MQKRTPTKLAIFDFDGTLTTRDTTFGFIFFYAGKTKTITALVSIIPQLVLAKLGYLKIQTVKEKLFRNIFGGHAITHVKMRGDEFGTNEIPLILHLLVYAEMKRLQEEGFEILLLSASCSAWLSHWCKKENIELLCSEMEEEDGVYTGNLQGKNCYGKEKVVRLNVAYDLKKIKEIVAYGNHHSDLHYMKLAHKAFMVKGENVMPYE